MLTTRLVTEVPAAWDTLVASSPAATAAHRPDVWRAFAATMNMQLHFAAVMQGDSLAGGAGALVERRGGMRWVHSMPMLLPGAPLATDGLEHEVDMATARAFAELQQASRAVGGEWAFYRPCRPAPEETVLAPVAGETRWLEAAIVDVDPTDGLDAALRRMDRKTRGDVRRARRRLHFSEDALDLEEAYTLYLRQARGWRGHRPLPLELSRRLLADENPAGPCARLFTVRDARGVLSATLALDHPRETMLWWSGSHAEARRALAFPVLLWSIIEWAHAAGRMRINLGASAERGAVASFKATLGARGYDYPVRWMDASCAPWLGRAVATVQRHVRRRRARGASA